jgi:hypothetical protein
MATLATQVLAHAGTAPTYASAGASGDKCAVGSGLFLQVKNSDSSSHTVTIPIPETIDGQAVTSRVVTIPATGSGGTKMIPMLDIYKQPSDGLAHFTYDANTDLTVAVIQVS